MVKKIIIPFILSATLILVSCGQEKTNDQDKTKIGIESATFHYDRGCDYIGKGQYDQAISEFNKAIEINPRSAF